MNFGEKIEKILDERNISKKELAEKLEISAAAVTTWKTRKNYPTVDKLVKICQILKISADELLEINTPPPPDSEFTPEEREIISHYRGIKEGDKVVFKNLLELQYTANLREEALSTLKTG